MLGYAVLLTEMFQISKNQIYLLVSVYLQHLSNSLIAYLHII